ncbi:MAG: ribose 5-phosphate isomerase A, partial [Chloroflexi bacterium]|nr:ribose 5-phosphate isomerase A [Chloroflexota bacterium]
DRHPVIDVTIDGADEVDPQLDLIKGRHGYLLREKIVAAASRLEIIVVDETKLVARLGTRSTLPVEVVRFGWTSTQAALTRIGARTVPRMVGERPFATDEGHCIIDCSWEGGIAEPRELQGLLQNIPGVVSTGLFLGLAHLVVVARASGIAQLSR